MKNLLKKPWFIGTLMLGLMLIIFLLNLWIMSLKLPHPIGVSMWTLSNDFRSGEPISIFSFVFEILFYVSFVPMILSGISILRKKSHGFILAIVYFLSYQTLFVIFQTILGSLSIFQLVLVGFNFLFSIMMLVLHILRIKALGQMVDIIKSEKEINLSFTKIPLAILIIDFVALIVLLSTFVIPVYTVVLSSRNDVAILANVLFSNETRLQVIIYFLVNFALFLASLLYFANCISYYYYDKESFINKSKILISYVFIVSLMFFFMGLTMNIYHTLIGDISQTIAYIPMLLMSVVIFVFAMYMGKFHALNQTVNEKPKTRFHRIEPLIYVFILSVLTGLMLLIYILRIEIVSGAYTESVKLSGLDILKDYPNLDPGYRIIAFALVVMFISSGMSLVIAISSYLAKYRKFDSIVKSVSAVNIFFIFIISISGYYFQIGQRIDQAVILNILDYYGVTLPSGLLDYTYTIRTDAIYLLIASIVVLIIMFLRKAFERDDLSALDIEVSSNGGLGQDKLSSGTEIEDEVYNNFDPCPAFTELDERAQSFKDDLALRKTLKTKGTTLNELINFIVEYARNSRLHLSYTEEDIATFVAGLGASKLSILQGMSGTGKTSLPKIFSEAVFGNCEIIEVESSWKDKNELLGYYNEFSMKYTPKKFTLALYKAALNQDIFTFILLDEMNLSRIEYYFSDFLSLMENEAHQREIKLINIKLNRKEEGNSIDYLALKDGHTLKVPENVWFIGTANRDESTFVISDKVYDRAQTMNFTKRAPKVRNYSNPIQKQYYDYQTINDLFEEAKQTGTFDAENSELIKSVESLLAPFNISFGNRILKQIEDFVNIYKACFSNEDVEAEAIEKILLSKVVAKLEVKTIDDKEKLEMEFQKLHLYQCVDFIKRLDNE